MERKTMLHHNFGDRSKKNFIMTETEVGRAVRNSTDQLFTFYDFRPVFHGHATVMRSASQPKSVRHVTAACSGILNCLLFSKSSRFLTELSSTASYNVYLFNLLSHE